MPDWLGLNHLSLAQAAEQYAAMGFSVFPLQPGSKLPLRGWAWKRVATHDVTVVRSWWQQWPEANIGLALGEPSGADALDVDMKNGQEGWRSYQAIVQERYPGPVQQTPTGGHHLLFQHTPGYRNFTHKGQLGGLDMRTTGGYIVAAPSATPEGRYAWVQEGLVPTMPTALRVACEQWSTAPNTQVAELPDIPEDLPDVRLLGLKQQYLDYLQRGDTRAWQEDESRAVYATAGALMRRLQDASLVFGIMASNDYAWACAMRHRPFGNVAEWLWKYGIGKIVTEVGAQKPLDASQVFTPVPTHAAPEIAAPGAPQEQEVGFWVPASHSRARASLRPRWLVQGIVERGQVGVVYGASQSLKSYVMLDLAISVAMGRDWHGLRVPHAGRVWYLAGEGNAILWRRLEAYRQHHGLRPEDLDNLSISAHGLNLMDPEHQQFLRESAEREGPPVLLIVDTLTANAYLEENSAREAAQLLGICQGMAHEWDCTPELVHHGAKGDKTSMRGSSVFMTNADSVLYLERHQGSSRAPVTQVWTQKLKGAPEPNHPLVFQGELQQLIGVPVEPGDDIPTDLVLRRLEGEEARTTMQEARTRARMTQRQAEVWGALQEVMAGHHSMASPGVGIGMGELMNLYLLAHPGTNSSTLKKDLTEFVRRGLLDEEDVGGERIFSMSVSKAALTPGAEEGDD